MTRRGILLAITLLACSAPAAAARPLAGPVSPRIVGGTGADPGEFPSQAFVDIALPGGETAFCGGTVIGPRQVLTAAHCSVDEDTGEVRSPDAFLIVLGENSITQASVGPEEEYGVTRVDVHEDFGSPAEFANDVALLTLDRNAYPDVTNPEVAPMPLVGPGDESLWDTGTTATIIGWGATTASPSGGSSAQLQKAQVPIVADSDCRDDYAGQITIDSDTMVCAGDGTHDTCQGDSGGPLLVEDEAATAFVLAGVVSFGIGCADVDFPGVYARVGAPGLNAWVRGRLHAVDFSQSPTARATVPAAFAATAGAGTGNFLWDFDDDGVFDASGASVSHTFPTAGPHRVLLRATDPDGQPAERRRTITVDGAPGPPPPPPPPDLTRPTLSSASVTSRAFAVDRSTPPETPVSAANRGTTFRYVLSEDARVVFTIDRALPGRRSGKRCVAQTRRNRGKRKCTRYQRFGRFAVASKALTNSKRFSGRIGSKAMKPGVHRATLVATDAAGNHSLPKIVKLTVVRR